LIDQAADYLMSITQFSKVAVNAIRACAAVAGPQVTEQGLAIEREKVIEVGQSEDAVEGVTAFREKRKPVFSHR